MPLISLQTLVSADIRICFDLARSIELHTISTGHTREKAIDGKVSGLIGPDEFVTWQAWHLGFRQRLSSRITAMNRPFHFRDEQIRGPFSYIRHDHYFLETNGMVLMKDDFSFSSPFGWIGKATDRLFLTGYLSRLLSNRNKVLKDHAESDKWKGILNSQDYR